MRATELFIQSNLAEVNHKLGDIDAALPHFRRAVDVAIDTLRHPFENGEAASKSLHAVAMAYFDRQLDSEARQAADAAAQAREDTDPKSPHSTTLQAAEARFRYITDGTGKMTASFVSAIADAEAEFGVRSDQVQAQHAALAQVLVDFGHLDEAIAVMRERMLDLDYWYNNRLVFDVPETEIGTDGSELTAKFIRTAKLEAERIAEIEAVASKSYQAGEHDTAFAKYLEAADLGSVESQFMIGTFYQCGIGCEIDMVKAREYYLYASRQNHKVAQHYYGALLQMGLGGDVDIRAAAYWYKRSADQDFLPALDNLCACYWISAQGSVSYCSAIELRLRAAKAGNTSAMIPALEQYRQPVAALIRI
ncbi:tetratricopeptide repeat protein [Hyphobacterium marinum]|uniref:Tetratricopeptide repeat protein n=1 Tax=Hyphobacterium marinum TaxID=3116574 RepID=A0ABU7LY32_9PROT|nr:tetratricopeptide repeat protein [Hyphobacterium sp. Y6023]MEE2566472.1 tetratricopeptide repeat protein [Hyphobacterium sp. Y6023]